MNGETEQLIKRSQLGDANAFGKLVNEYSNYLFSVIFRIVHLEEAAEDLVQETFIKVWLKLNTYNSQKSKFSTWLYTIATRLCLDWLKSNKKHDSISTINVDYFEGDVSPETQLQNKEIGVMLEWLCQKLSDQQKLVFVLRDLEQFEVSEVIEITGYTEKKVNDTLYVARLNMRKMLENYIKREV